MTRQDASDNTQPTPRQRRRLDPEERRSELLDAAIEVIRRQGSEEVRVVDITRAAGAAKGTFYLYFPSWNDLLLAIRRRLMSTYAADVRARMEAARPMQWEQIEQECIHFVDYVAGLGGLHGAIFHGPIADEPVEAEYSSGALITLMLKAAVQAGVCRKVSPELAAPLVFAVLHTTADGIMHGDDRAGRIEAMLDLLRAWLRSDPDDRRD